MQSGLKLGLVLIAVAGLQTAIAAQPEPPRVASEANSCIAVPANPASNFGVPDGKQTPQLKDLPSERFSVAITCDERIGDLTLKSKGADIVLSLGAVPTTTSTGVASSVQVLPGGLAFVSGSGAVPQTSAPPIAVPVTLNWSSTASQSAAYAVIAHSGVDAYYSYPIVVANAASYGHIGVIAPGELISVFGAAFAPDANSGLAVDYENSAGALLSFGVHPENGTQQFEWQGWRVEITSTNEGKTATVTFTRNQSAVDPLSLLSLLGSTPPLDAIEIGFAANPARAGPSRQTISDPFGLKKPKILSSNTPPPMSCGLPRPKHSFGISPSFSSSARTVFVCLSNTVPAHRPILAATPLITPLRT